MKYQFNGGQGSSDSGLGGGAGGWGLFASASFPELKMQRFLLILLGLISVTSFAGGPTHNGGLSGDSGSNRTNRSQGTPDPSSYGILADKSPQKANSPSIPEDKMRDLAKWYNRNKDDLNRESWSNPNIVSDDRVSEIKTEFAKAVGFDQDKIGRELKIGFTRDGRVQLTFKSTGEVFYYTPPKAKQSSVLDGAR